MKSLRQVWAAAQGNPRNPKIAKRFKRNKNQEAKRPLIPLTPLKTAAKRRWESEGIEITRPLCGIQRDGNRKSQGALARSRSGRVCRRQRTAPLCEFPGRFPLRQVLGRQPYRPHAKHEKAKIRERSVT